MLTIHPDGSRTWDGGTASCYPRLLPIARKCADCKETFVLTTWADPGDEWRCHQCVWPVQR